MSNIDEKAKNNFTIEMRIFENYEKVKYEIIKVIDFLRHSETNLGMCRIFDNQNHEFWHSVIKPWFQPDRFGIEYLYKTIHFPGVNYVDYIKVVKPIGIFNYWYKYRIEDIPENERYKFYWYPLTLEFNEVRAKLLEKVISEFENEFKEK